MSIADWLDMMPHTVTTSVATGRDAYGKPTYSAPSAAVRARVVYKSVEVAAGDGEQVMARGEVWLAGYFLSLKTNDRVNLPDGSSPPILSLEHIPDENGGHHTKVFFG